VKDPKYNTDQTHWSRPLISRDNGKTFTLGGPWSRGEGFNFDENMIVERSNGNLVVITRGKNGIPRCESTDQGLTWRYECDPPIPALPSQNTRFVFMKLQSGHWLLVTHGDSKGKPPKVPHIKGTQLSRGRYRLMAMISKDEGTTWSEAMMLEPGEASYPYGCQAADGTIYITYEHYRWNHPQIRMARFTEDDVFAGKPVTERAALKILVNKATGSAPLSEKSQARLIEVFGTAD
jgi:hypothetical protein